MIRIIASDLDGTLLTSDKEITKRTYRALEKAAAKGVHIVPATGRMSSILPENVASLPFVRYMILINGAEIYDLKERKTVYRRDMDPELAVSLLEYLDGHDLIYDCYMENCGYMTASHYDKGDSYAPNVHVAKMIHDGRKPVPELKSFIKEKGLPVQKVQFFTHDLPLRERLLKELPLHFDGISVSSSYFNNVEINEKEATKGNALEFLCRHLGIDISESMAFGDGLNDLDMIEKAGMGIAMLNSSDMLLKAADMVTLSCDEDGVAQMIERYVTGE